MLLRLTENLQNFLKVYNRRMTSRHHLWFCYPPLHTYYLYSPNSFQIHNNTTAKEFTRFYNALFLLVCEKRVYLMINRRWLKCLLSAMARLVWYINAIMEKYITWSLSSAVSHLNLYIYIIYIYISIEI